MGNQMSGSEGEEANISERHSSHVVNIDQSHSRPKPIPKSRIRLVPLSGSPSTSADNAPFSSLSNSNGSRNAESRESNMPVYHLTPNQRRSANQLSEEEQVKIAQRIGLIQHLPRSTWDNSQVENKKVRECCICMIDFEDEEPIRYLPCMHYYHVNCIDDWLMRSFTCPTCMEPVDAALLSSYGNHNVTTES
ncbi:RING finger protein 11-like isoform X1 [Styela clava]|uniref:RING finger protein 11-like isoform X1 n=1 Tax=Styela clava TaxID=7725 RepID=UPI001939D363|nr:RING finger protein 11-like isoform X1 [Styela clava]